MNKKVAFLEERLAESAPPTCGEVPLFKAVRLAEAAAGLAKGARTQPFGLSLDDETANAVGPLRERAIELLGEWSAALPAKEKKQLAKEMKRLGLPVFVSLPPPKLHARIAFTIPVELRDDASGEPVLAPSVLACFDGAKADGGNEIHTYPCVSEAAGGTPELDGEESWAIGSSAVLAYQEEPNELVLRLTIDAARVPTKKNVERLVTAVREELFMSGWGTNLDWHGVSGEPAVTVAVNEDQLRYELVKVSKASKNA